MTEGSTREELLAALAERRHRADELSVLDDLDPLAYSFLLGLGFGAYISIDLALMTEVLPATLRGSSSAGRDLAILGLATTQPQALSPSIAAGLVSLTGGYPVLFVAGIVFVLAGALAVTPIKAVR